MTSITTKLHEYSVDGSTFLGYLAFDGAVHGPRPAVIVCHAWYGRTEFENKKAEALARLGYVGFAADVYGKGVRGSTPEENMKLIKPLMDDRKMLLARLKGALEAVKGLPQVDKTKICAIGFCFGGTSVLDMARAGLGLEGVVSFHGSFTAPTGYETVPVLNTRVLALHGDADFHIPPEQIRDFEKELRDKKADWQLHVYGNAFHAFTNPTADDVARGVKYDEKADRRSWATMKLFLQECFT